MRPLGAALLFTLIVAIGLHGVADVMGIHDARAGQCSWIFAVVYGIKGIACVRSPTRIFQDLRALGANDPSEVVAVREALRANAKQIIHWYDFGLSASAASVVLPSLVQLGWRLPPPLALLVVLAVASAGVYALERRRRRS